LSSNGGRLPDGQVGGETGVRGGQFVGSGLVDLSGFTLRDLGDLRDADRESYLARALSRFLAPTEVDGHHGFQSKI
jgi:hypothetical protein